MSNDVNAACAASHSCTSTCKHWTHPSLASASLVNPTGLSLEICRARARSPRTKSRMTSPGAHVAALITTSRQTTWTRGLTWATRTRLGVKGTSVLYSVWEGLGRDLAGAPLPDEIDGSRQWRLEWPHVTPSAGKVASSRGTSGLLAPFCSRATSPQCSPATVRSK